MAKKQEVTTEGIVAEELKQFIERAERMAEEIADAQASLKDIFAEAKGRGFDTKALRKILSLRKKDHAERQEEKAILELYMQAIGMA